MDPLHTRFEPPFPEVPVADKAADNLKYNFFIDLRTTGFAVTRKIDNLTMYTQVYLILL